MEKRRFIRYDALHLLDYTVVHGDGSTGIYSMGRTLDVSVDGIKLEINDRLEPGTQLLVIVGLEDNLVELLGKIVYTTAEAGRFVSGIEFKLVTKEGRTIFARYTEAFRQRRRQLLEAGRTD